MDIKTLEYMGTRVDKARQLTKDIVTLGAHVEFLENSNIQGVIFDTYQKEGIRLGNSYNSKLTNSVIPEIKAAAVNALIAYRYQLQKELDEL